MAGLGRVAAWVPAVLVVPAVMVGAVTVSVPDQQGGAMGRISPMEPGTTWVYDVFDHGKPSGTRTKQITGQAAIDAEHFDAVTQASAYTDYPGQGPTGNTVYLAVEGDALNQYALDVNHEHLLVDPPAAAYEFPFEEGHSWSYDGLVGDNGVRFEVELEAILDVEVGGRTFTGCGHYVTQSTWKFSGQKKFGPPSTQEEWVCPGYGVVRYAETNEEQDVELTEELTEFHGVDSNWYAEAPSAPAVAEQPGGGLGIDAARSNTVEGTISADLAWSDGRSARFDFPPVADDDVMVLAERDGEVSATDHATGEVRWRVRLEGPVVVTPVLAGDQVLVADSAKHLWALSLADGTARWVRTFDDMVSASPAVSDGVAVVSTDDRRVTALDLGDSSTLWQVLRSSLVRSAPAVDGDQVVVADVGGDVSAYTLADGTETWSRSLESGVLAGPAVAGGRVVVGDADGVIYGLDAADGGLLWEQRTIFFPSQPFAVTPDTVVSLGDGERLEAYDAETGEDRWTRKVPTTRVAPVVVGDQVVSVDNEGTVRVLALDDGHEDAAWEVPHPGPDSGGSVHGPLGLVADALVVNVDHGTPGHYSALYAYPVSEAGARPGISFATELRSAGDGAGGAAVLAGDAMFLPDYQQALIRVGSDDEPVTLFDAEGLLPGVVAAGDVVLAQRDDQLEAWPTAAGATEPLWSYKTVNGYPGQVPSVGGDRVFLPQAATGLAAVDLATGRELWKVPLTLAYGSGPPLALPDGDVVYGGSALGRYDGATGAQEWSIFDGVLFAPAAYDQGIVYGDVTRALSPSGLVAVDAETGRELWTHENPNTLLGVGPAAGAGVVVGVDSQGRVTALDGRTGEELWHVLLHTGIGGQPMIRDGVAYLTELGRTADIFQREYRISAHDLRTGQFLGALQPPGSAFTLMPSGSVSDGALLLPASFSRSVVMVLRPQP